MKRLMLFVISAMVLAALPVQASGLLKKSGTVQVGATETFVAADRFIAGASRDTGDYYTPAFKQFFLGKTEKNVPAAVLTAYVLQQDLLDAPVLAELGGRPETTLFYLWQLMAKQPRGEPGPLVTEGYVNIFYIRGTDGTLRAVAAGYRAGRGWYVSATPLESPGGWFAGAQVFSH